ncbi:MAG: class I SAM-dependent methyltransferase [Treponema sp.]
MEAKKEYQKKIFANRLIKQYKTLSKWARKNDIYCYRLYDKDIPEIPLLLELYTSNENIPYLSVTLYKRPYDIDEDEEIAFLNEFTELSASLLEVPLSNVSTKIREKQKGLSQYNKMSNSKKLSFITKEGKAFFYINISDYLDVGLFLDNRPLRMEVAKEAKDKSVLNLFCYTASFSIHAALGGARSVCSVDSSKTALLWAEENMRLNGINHSNSFVLKNEEVMTFLDDAIAKHKKWDIIVCDPPTFSNSKRWEGFFDVNRDYLNLCCKCIKLLENEGILYFSSNSKRIKFDEEALHKASNQSIFIKDISKNSIPLDFRNKKIHKAWKIKKEEH